MNKCMERLYNGIIKENPTFVLMLGMCPTLATTTTAVNGVGMGLTTTAVLIFSNLIISSLRKIIPDRVRIPAYIVIVASLVTIVQLFLKAYIPFLDKSLGIFIPLIVVNCIILGRAEAYAAKNGPLSLLLTASAWGWASLWASPASPCFVSFWAQALSSGLPSSRRLTRSPSSGWPQAHFSSWQVLPLSRTS